MIFTLQSLFFAETQNSDGTESPTSTGEGPEWDGKILHKSGRAITRVEARTGKRRNSARDVMVFRGFEPRTRYGTIGTIHFKTDRNL